MAMNQSYAVQSQSYVWDINTLDWVKSTAGDGSSSDVTVTNFPATQPVTGSFYQATQPVSIASMPPTPVTSATLSTEATLAALNAKVTAVNTGAVVVTSAPTTAVTGPLTDAQLRAADVKITLDGDTVPVTGTFYQATQPVSLASMPSTPVTGPLTDAQLRAVAVPVSGEFYPVTQPVSLATAPTTPVTGPLTDAQLRAADVKVTLDSEVVPVTGTFFQATQPVSLASAPSTAVTNANLDAALSTLATQATLAALYAGSGKTLKTKAFSLSATGEVIPLVAAKRLKVYAVKLVVSAAISVKWRDGAATDLEGAQPLAANGGYVEAGITPPSFFLRRRLATRSIWSSLEVGPPQAASPIGTMMGANA